MLDVGANIGYYALEGAHIVGPTGSVIAVEAAPPHANALRANIARNGFHNVLVHEMAVSDFTGKATLSLPAKNRNLGMYTLADFPSDYSFEVHVCRLDELVKGRIDFMKIDIEGSEYRALRGAEKILRRYRPPILIELNEAALTGSGSSSMEVMDFLRALGYQAWMLGKRSVRVPEADLPHFGEYLFVSRTDTSLIARLRLPKASSAP